MFKGEKTTVFWIGLAVLGYSIFQFSNAAWQIIYYRFFYALPGITGEFESAFTGNMILEAGIPGIMAGTIFLIIALIIMRVGTKKPKAITQQPEQLQKT